VQVTNFRLQNPEYVPVDDPVFPQSDAVFRLPQLPAYAMHHSQLALDNNFLSEGAPQQPEYRLTTDTLVLASSCVPMLGKVGGWLTVYHNGIKDHRLLFPHIDNEALQLRLGQFAEEAANAFASQSWLSYVLMVGGVLEGLLYHEYKLRRFVDMITAAQKSGLVNEQEASQINLVRFARNQIHADKYNQTIPGRSLALDISVTYERLLRRDWRTQEG
jgi:hypothetical protein